MHVVVRFGLDSFTESFCCEVIGTSESSFGYIISESTAATVIDPYCLKIVCSCYLIVVN